MRKDSPAARLELGLPVARVWRGQHAGLSTRCSDAQMLQTGLGTRLRRLAAAATVVVVVVVDRWYL